MGLPISKVMSRARLVDAVHEGLERPPEDLAPPPGGGGRPSGLRGGGGIEGGDGVVGVGVGDLGQHRAGRRVLDLEAPPGRSGPPLPVDEDLTGDHPEDLVLIAAGHPCAPSARPNPPDRAYGRPQVTSSVASRTRKPWREGPGRGPEGHPAHGGHRCRGERRRSPDHARLLDRRRHSAPLSTATWCCSSATRTSRPPTAPGPRAPLRDHLSGALRPEASRPRRDHRARPDHAREARAPTCWHTDNTFMLRPPLGSDPARRSAPLGRRRHVLRQHVRRLRGLVPGDASPCSSLSGPLTTCPGCCARPSPTDRPRKTSSSMQERWPPVTHPVIRTNPQSGRKSLFINGQWAVFIEGLTERENAVLLPFLCDHVRSPEFQCRFHWRAQLDRLLGQPLGAALRRRRLHRAAHHAAGHDRGRTPGLIG